MLHSYNTQDFWYYASILETYKPGTYILEKTIQYIEKLKHAIRYTKGKKDNLI